MPSIVSRRTLYIVLMLLALLCGALSLWAWWLDQQVREQFEGKRWAVPASVYARPLELYEGLALTLAQLQEELDSLGYQRVARPTRPGQYSVNGAWLELNTRAFQFSDGEQPPQHARIGFRAGRISRLLDAQDRPLALLRLEPMVLGKLYHPARQEDRVLVRLEQAPPYLLEALVAVEDRDFHTHFGVSPKAIARAALANFKAGRVVQGGSTLTQQLVKNFFLSHEQTLWRKAQEAIMALLLEWRYSKQEILEAYLNEVFLAQDGQRAIHGFGLASRYLFGKPLERLALHEASLLVAMVKGPSYYDPRRHPERALRRRNLVLELLLEQGVIETVQYQQSVAQALGVLPRAQVKATAYPAFMDLVRRQLQQDYREEDLVSEGLRVFTSFDPLVQRQAEQALTQTLQQLQQQHGDSVSPLQAAVAVTGTDNGEVLALIGGRELRYAGFNRVLDARRPIGSLIKPVLYLTALEQGYTLASPLRDEPVSVPQPDGSVWEPHNFDREAHGVVLLHEALSRSYNLATVNLGLEIGVDTVLERLRALGIEHEFPPYPAMLLGAMALSPLEVTALYQTLAAEGFQTPLRAIRSVQTAEGEALQRYPLQLKQVIQPEYAHLLHYLLQETMREGTGRSAYYQLPGHLNLAGKTGTSNEQRDSWFVGYSGNYLATVWLGRDDNGATPLTGSSGALRVWSALMQRLQPEVYRAQAPAAIEYHWVDGGTGLRSARYCENARAMPFIQGTAPEQPAPCVRSFDRLANWFKGWLQP